MGRNLSGGCTLSDPSTHVFDIPLRSKPIPIVEIILPVVNIHINTQGDDHWVFNYSVAFTFDDGRQFSFDSNVNGDYSGIGPENSFVYKPPTPRPGAVDFSPGTLANIDHISQERHLAVRLLHRSAPCGPAARRRCDEAPSDIKNSQAFIKTLVETVVSSPELGQDLAAHHL